MLPNRTDRRSCFTDGKGGVVAEQAPVSFARLLRQLRTEAGLTQEGLAQAASLRV